MSILEIKGLSHTFDNKILFEKADLTVMNGEHIGVVGLNGAGKSTFINILAGRLVQDDGLVKWNSSCSRGYLDQHADIDRNKTVMEYLTDSFSRLHEMNARLEKLYEKMGETTDSEELERLIDKSNSLLERLTDEGFFDLDATVKKVANGLGVGAYGYDTPIANLSGGQRAKLMLSRLLLEKPDLMLLDEPTNFLDVEHIEWLIDFLNSFKGTFLVISHDTDFLNRVSKFIVGIENGRIEKYGGNYVSYLAQREQKAKQYEESYIRQQREIEKMEDYINRNKARAATAGMANARKKQLEKMERIKKPSVIYDAVFSFPYVELHTRDLIVADSLEIGYDFPLLPPLNIHLKSDDKLWIRGTNGVGKTTLVKTLTGLLKPLGGSYRFHPFVKIGYIEQEPNFADGTINAVTYVSDRLPRLDSKQIRNTLALSGIKNDLAVKPIRELSGGEQVRVKLTVLTNTPTNLLILDEPTNHLDVRAKESLKTALKDYKGAVLLVSHEREFAESICGDVLDVRGI